ncbi:GIN domain-containing protein [Mucilaginibacter pedocola]|nr:DUF2807 domain-containing protein [Mucilaginibacter pedocola]
MKHLFLTAIMTVALGAFQPTYANTIKDDAFTILEAVGNISSIEVHGNVELFVTDAAADQIKVYNKYYAENAVVQNRDGRLHISSYGNEKLVIWVKAKDLRSVELFDNAQVSSFGTLSKIELKVALHNNSSANLNLDAYKLSLDVQDNAKADIQGGADVLNLNKAVEQNVNRGNFAAMNVYENKQIAVAAKQVSAI